MMYNIKSILKRTPIGILYVVYAVSALCMSVVTLLGTMDMFSCFIDMLSYGGNSAIYNVADSVEDIVYDILHTLDGDESLLVIILILFIPFSLTLWYVFRNDESKKKIKTISEIVFRINICLMCVIVAYDNFSGGRLISDKLISVAAIIISALIAELMSMLIIRSSERVSWRNFIAFFAVLLLTIGTYGFVRLDISGSQRYIPLVENVDRVSLSGSSFESADGIEKVRQLNTMIIDCQKQNEEADEIERIYITYYLKDGRELDRTYLVESGTDDEYSEQVKFAKELISTREAALSRYEISNIDELTHFVSYAKGTFINPDTSEPETNVDLSVEQFKDLYKNCILPDIMDGNLRLDSFARQDTEYHEAMSNIEIGMNYMNEDAFYRGYHFYIDMTATRTLKWMEENLGAEIITMKEDILQSYQ